MNPNDTDLPMSDTVGTAAASTEITPAAPAKRRAPRKPKIAPAADAADAAAAAAVVDEASAGVPPGDEQRFTPVALEVAVAADAADAALPDAPAADAQEPAPQDGTARTEGRRRGRNRRRGRRGGDGARAVDAAAPDDDAAQLEMPADGEAPAVAPAPSVAVGELFAEVLSGSFDIEPTQADEALPVEPAKRVLAAQPDAPKLHKVLAQAGIGSRRDMEQLIEEGRITVNGGPAHVGQRISFGDLLRIDGKPIKARIAPPPPRVLAYHKPAGEVVTRDDPEHRPTVFRKLPRLAQGKWQSVGRLDINTEGLLLFTNSGELANQLMHPRFGVEREYAVRVLGAIDEAARARLLEGVVVDGQSCAFKSLEDGGGEGANRWYRVVITEGRNREVRKLFEAVGHAVSRLIRIRYGSVVLPRGLRRGVCVDLEEVDVWALRRMTRPGGGDMPAPRPNNERRTNRRKRGARNTAAREPAEHFARDDQPPLERPRQAERGRRGDRRGRDDRAEGGERAERGDWGEGGAIPNPLQQTYDKRAIQQARAQRPDPGEDGPIPNPLQQTYDKRAIQQERSRRAEISEDGPIPNPLQQTYDKRFTNGGGIGAGKGADRRGAGRRKGAGGGGGSRQPDPMQTAVGYIGADAFTRKGAGRSRGPARGKPGRGNRGGSGGGNKGGQGRR